MIRSQIKRRVDQTEDETATTIEEGVEPTMAVVEEEVEPKTTTNSLPMVLPNDPTQMLIENPITRNPETILVVGDLETEITVEEAVEAAAEEATTEDEVEELADLLPIIRKSKPFY